MPELPEVETVRRGIAPVLEGHKITQALARRADLRWPLPERFAERLSGRRVERLNRRSKYILASLAPEKSCQAQTWLIHLGMSGRITIDTDPQEFQADRVVGRFHYPVAKGTDQRANEAVEVEATQKGFGKHDHIIVTTSKGRLIYNDARRFGAMDLWDTEDLANHPWLAHLGPEPLGNDFHAQALGKALAGRKAPIKALLLDQRIVAGLGNIYVCEALWRAGIAPTRPGGSLLSEHLEKLVRSIRTVLQEAIAAGGSSLRDHRQADGSLGYFQHAFKVYGRAEEPCSSEGCSAQVERIVQSGRSTFYCPRCQS
ncbi:MAG: bifunctional DNA-formamidopyrimidine glycosylase/DNA-(apurinic or apyrimidinic site) lyase [Neomegalonema sp.]|nr:bifunctional DNA-formamidopyrimidine glycosylase/DNA-(apurinic or apyrimidinic site) lyase [Neomegalonema sp.]